MKKILFYPFTGRDIGFVAESFSDELLYDSDTLIISDSATERDSARIYEIIIKGIEAKKEIFCYAKLGDEARKKLIELAEIEKVSLCFFHRNKWFMAVHEVAGGQEVYDINIPVVCVCGLIQDGNQEEVLLGLAAQLTKKGLKIGAIAESKVLNFIGFYSYKDIMEQHNVTDRIYAINSLAKHIEDIERPDIIIIQIPGNVMRYNKKYPDDFGSGMFEFSQAFLPDYCICSVLNEQYNKAFFDMLSNKFIASFKFDLDCMHITNRIVNTVISLEKNKLCFYKIPQNDVFKTIEKINEEEELRIFHLLNEVDLIRVTDGLLKKLGAEGEK